MFFIMFVSITLDRLHRCDGHANGLSRDVMHAVRIHEFGGPEVLKYEEAPRPAAEAGQVLIKVHAAGVNPVDWKIRGGNFGRGALPMTLGLDVSGTVESVGDGVDGFKAGDEVYSYLPISAGGGYAEYVAAPASAVAAKPKTIDHVHAAAVPLAALTAWQALFDQAKLKEGQTVLIHAGAGGVGHFAVQFAHHAGAKVMTTASGANLEFVKGLGADVAIDYTKEKFEERVKEMGGVDVVFDMIGGDTADRSYGLLKKGGTFVSIVGRVDQAKLKEREAKGVAFLVHPDSKQLAEIGSLIDGGKVVPHVSDVFPLAEAAKAHEKSQTGKTRGKIVLDVTGDAPKTTAPASK